MIAANGQRQHVVRRVNSEQAAVVGQIFELYLSGKGLTRIAKTLNASGIAPARHGAHGWAPSAIREILYRPLYKGELVWNQSQKLMKGGTKHRRRRPERDWVRPDAPELQIIPQALWQAVQDRLATAKRLYARGTQNGRPGTLMGRPTLRDFDSPYLLSGLARCSCGGPLGGITRDHKRSGRRFYGCLYFHKRGASVCPNALLIEQDQLDRAVLARMQTILTRVRIERVIDCAVALYRQRQDGWQDRQGAMTRELAEIEGRIQHLVDAICRGGQEVESLIERLKQDELRKKALLADLALQAPPLAVRGDVVPEIRQRLTDVAGLLGRSVPQARQMLRKLLTEPMQCVATTEGGAPGYCVIAKGSYGHLLPPVFAATQVVSPTGFSQRGYVDPFAFTDEIVVAA